MNRKQGKDKKNSKAWNRKAN